MSSGDDSEQIVAAVEEAYREDRCIAIMGHGSKPNTTATGDAFVCTADHSGILEYRPSELVVSVRAGTPLKELNDELARNGQMIAPDPPIFNQRGTVGGAVASGLSGPGRPWYGSLRDCVLGVEVINGLAQRLSFGGRVIKNVAGFDVSRLYTGSWGTFGVILSASFKLLPMPEVSFTVEEECSDIDAFQKLADHRRERTTLTGTCHFQGRLFRRFAGAESAVRSETDALENCELNDTFSWADVRDHELSFFQDDMPLWRATFDRGEFFENVDDLSSLSEWYGSLAWIKTPTETPPTVRGANVQVSAFRNAVATKRSVTKYASRLRKAFDPKGIFNPHIVV